jgi:predicted transcriptional regulator
MAMARRDRVEIMAEILDLCLKPKGKTQVMYGTNMSWKMLKHYLSYMEEHGLLKALDNSSKYVATDKGQDFLDKWNDLKNFF